MATVEVIYHGDPEGWWADSSDIPGYGAAGATLGEVRDLVREGIPFFLETSDVEIEERFPFTVIGVSIKTGIMYPTIASTSGVSSKATFDEPEIPLRVSEIRAA